MVVVMKKISIKKNKKNVKKKKRKTMLCMSIVVYLFMGV